MSWPICDCGHLKAEHHADGVCAGDDYNVKENCRCAGYGKPYPAPPATERMTDHHVICRHCGVGINVRCDEMEDNDQLTAKKAEIAALKSERDLAWVGSVDQALRLAIEQRDKAEAERDEELADAVRFEELYVKTKAERDALRAALEEIAACGEPDDVCYSAHRVAREALEGKP